MPSGLLKARGAPAAASTSQASGIAAATSSAVRIVPLGGGDNDAKGVGPSASSGGGSAPASPRAEGVLGDPAGSAAAAAPTAEGDGLGEAAERGCRCRRASATIPAASPTIPAATSAVATTATSEAHPEGEPARAPTRHHGAALTSSNAVGRPLR